MRRSFYCITAILTLFLLQFFTINYIRAGRCNLAFAGNATVNKAGQSKKNAGVLTTHEDFLRYYYKHPQPNNVLPVILLLSDKKMLNNHSGPIMACFFSHIFKQNENRLQDWQVHFKRLPDLPKRTMAYALRWSGTKTGNDILDAWAKDKYTKNVAMLAKNASMLDLINMPIRRAIQIDMLWASFMTTGETIYVDKVIALLGDKKRAVKNKQAKEKPQGPPEQLILVYAAAWSLTGNAIQHDAVRQRLRFFSNSSDETIRNETRKILADAEKKISERKKEK